MYPPLSVEAKQETAAVSSGDMLFSAQFRYLAKRLEWLWGREDDLVRPERFELPT
jgi:hypothetical protein